MSASAYQIRNVPERKLKYGKLFAMKPITETAGRALKFGETATTSSDVYAGFVFMVTSLHKDKATDEVTERLTLAGDESSSMSQGKLTLIAVVRARHKLCISS